MKEVVLIILVMVTISDSLSSKTRDNLLDILYKDLKVKDAIKGFEAHQLGSSLFKYYDDTLLPLQFQLWVKDYGRNYDNKTEHHKRQKIWSNNVKFIHEHNKLNKTYTLAMNHLGDMTNEEYKTKMLGMKITVPKSVEVDNSDEEITPPVSRDWRESGYVTPVKNQGRCGSCWAFSSTGSMEGAMMKKRGVLISLSEQNLVDCSKSFGNNGCNGGLMDFAFKYVIANGGIDTEESYPYEGEDEKMCRFDKNNSALQLTGYKDVIPAGSEKALKVAVAKNGPVSVAIDASQPSFQFYHTGVYNEPECSPENLDHGVLVVGYGKVAGGLDYWIVKNSWSTGWGEEGYIRMLRNRGNQCGVASSASYPIAM